MKNLKLAVIALTLVLAQLGVIQTSSAAPAIDVPTAVSARAGDAQALIRWTAPVNTNGQLVQTYTVTSNPGGLTCLSNGNPAASSCTVQGLTNGTAYTFTVVAATVNYTSAASVASIAVTPLSGTQNVNFIAEPTSSVQWHPDYVSATNARTANWPNYIYNYSRYNSTAQGTVISSSVVNDNPVYPNDCDASWIWVQILCDRSNSSNPNYPGADSLTHTYKGNKFNVGFTVDSIKTTEASIVIDLGTVQNFTTLRVFQMFSDGKVTEASIYGHPNTGTTWPTVGDANWNLLANSKVGAGYKNVSAQVTECPTALDFGATSSRYIKLSFRNQGEFGSVSWIEVGAAKLFFEQVLTNPTSSCPPEPPTNAAASAGDGQASLSWAAGPGTATSYLVQYSSDGGSTWLPATTSPASLTGSDSSAIVTGLSNGSNYVFRVAAANSVGSSPYTSATNTVSPSSSIPNPPMVSGVVAQSGAVEVSWTAVTGATSYTVTGSPSGSCTVNAPATSCVIPNLTPGIDYTFSVTSSNQTGTSGASLASALISPLAVTASPTPSPSPSSSGSSIGPITPSGALAPGAVRTTVAGQVIPTTVRPNSNSTALTVAGSGFTMELSGVDSSGRPLGVNADGALVLQEDRVASVSGTGFQPNSDVEIYVFSTPRFLGTVRTNSQGSYSGTVPLPASLATGNHTLQSNGFTSSGAIRSVSLGVVVQDKATKCSNISKSVYFEPMSAKLTEASKKRLKRLAKQIKYCSVIKINGYVQSGVNGSSNDATLSKARAKAVAKYLESRGVTAKVSYKGKGTPASQAREAQARRATIRIGFLAV